VAGRNPREAAGRFLAPIARALACVTPTRPIATGHAAGCAGVLTFPAGGAVTLGPRRLRFGVTMRYTIERTADPHDPRGPWKVRTLGYAYTLDAATGPELLAYHWHPDQPEGRRLVAFPHVHVRAIKDGADRRLCVAHLPTGRIALEDVLELLLGDFKVRRLRGDWRQVLGETRAAFMRYRTWPRS